MDWHAHVDIYCERLDPSFWAEPLNAVSNASFIIAAVWGTIVAYQRGLDRPSVWVLIVLAYCIGIGSFLFHTFATTWSGFADTLPIWTFVALYAVVSISLIGQVPPGKIVIGMIVLVCGVTLFTLASSDPDSAAIRDPGVLNGSEQYFPAVFLMLVITAMTLYRRHPIRWWFTAATVTFLVSLTFRTVDIAVCDVFPWGTHIFWHLLNGVVIALLLQALIRFTTRTELK